MTCKYREVLYDESRHIKGDRNMGQVISLDLARTNRSFKPMHCNVNDESVSFTVVFSPVTKGKYNNPLIQGGRLSIEREYNVIARVPSLGNHFTDLELPLEGALEHPLLEREIRRALDGMGHIPDDSDRLDVNLSEGGSIGLITIDI